MLTIVNEGLSLTIVKKGFSLTIVNETTNFLKTFIFGKTIIFEKNDMQLILQTIVINYFSTHS